MGQFIVAVGATGGGKTTLLTDFMKTLPEGQSVFLCDSNGSGKHARHVPFTTRVTEIAQKGLHEEATPRSQLLLFWSRLVNVIEHDVIPNLRDGIDVYMDGFGGTVLTHALCHTRSEEEKEGLIELHKSMIKHCVLGLGVSPPKYLWLKVSPDVAMERLRKIDKLPRSKDPLAHIEAINRGFEFYSSLQGQTVIQLNADKTSSEVFAEAMKHIDLGRHQLVA